MFGAQLARSLRRRRSTAAILIMVMLVGFQIYTLLQSLAAPSSSQPSTQSSSPSDVLADATHSPVDANSALEKLEVKGRAAKTGYTRAQFGDGWAEVSGCDVRNLILQRALQVKVLDKTGCKVVGGTLEDQYTAKTISFVRGESSSDAVQIDHVVALSDAWQKGAQQLEPSTRARLANDSLNLLAVDGDTNQKKGDSDAASWLPPNKDYRCRYVARQIAVKQKYELWVTDAEKSAIKRVLDTCPGQTLPIEVIATGTIYGVESGNGS